ncbi:nucleotidyltransferase family protein [Methanoregula formicica]|nr:nucleotidyltransferase family protein [Methanoregula formicica]
MITRQEVMVRLKSLKGELAARYDVREIGIFGSVARGENDPGSDIDLLVEFGSRADLLTYIGLWQYLEDSFGMKIDLVSKGGLRSEMRDAVMQDVVYV